MESALGDIRLGPVAETAIATLLANYYCDIWGVVPANDPRLRAAAVRLIDALMAQGSDLYGVGDSDDAKRGRLPQMVSVALRSRSFDEAVAVLAHPDAVVVSVGCGFDTRYFRARPDCARYIDMDLPEVIALKRSLVEEAPGYSMVGVPDGFSDETIASILESCGDRPLIVIVEGVFCYLSSTRVLDFITGLARHHHAAQLVCDFDFRSGHAVISRESLRLQKSGLAPAAYEAGCDAAARALTQIAPSRTFASSASLEGTRHEQQAWCYDLGTLKQGLRG